MYESTVVSMFSYLWGYRDGEKKCSPPSILSNQQTFLDSLIGDLVAKSHAGRWFLIEFKQKRAGFAAELKSKISRAQLLQHLQNDSVCREISAYAHFACWAESQVKAQQYVSATDDPYFKQQTPANTIFQGEISSFDDIYNALNEADMEAHHFYPEHLFWLGTGATGQGMYEYLSCVLSAFGSNLSGAGDIDALFGFVDPSQTPASVKMVPVAFTGLLAALAEAKLVAENSKAKSLKP